MVRAMEIGQYEFDANADEVAGLFAPGGVFHWSTQWPTVWDDQGSPGWGELQFTAHIDSAPANVMSVVIMATLYSADRQQRGAPESVGHIALQQAERGRCTAKLILTDDQRAIKTDAFAFGRDAIEKIWRIRFIEYCNRKKKSAKAPAGHTREWPRERADHLKKLKDEHPELSQQALATRATRELKKNVTQDDVRNDWKVNGWVWERSNEIR